MEPKSLSARYLELEIKVCQYLNTYGVSLLRYSMSIIYFWYGLLKVLGLSPVEELVFHATHWIGIHEFVIFLGVWEIVISLCLVIKKLNRAAIFLLFLQFPGTFLPLILNPGDCFTIFPYGLTLEGQYIFKNLVLIAVTLVIFGSLHSSKKVLEKNQ
ncbi:MAG: hypothetical protein ACOYK9_00575 [Chlamydiia bacterium]